MTCLGLVNWLVMPSHAVHISEFTDRELCVGHLLKMHVYRCICCLEGVVLKDYGEGGNKFHNKESIKTYFLS